MREKETESLSFTALPLFPSLSLLSPPLYLYLTPPPLSVQCAEHQMEKKKQKVSLSLPCLYLTPPPPPSVQCAEHQMEESRGVFFCFDRTVTGYNKFRATKSKKWISKFRIRRKMSKRANQTYQINDISFEHVLIITFRCSSTKKSFFRIIFFSETWWNFSDVWNRWNLISVIKF